MQLPALLDARVLHAEMERITKAGQGVSTGLWLPSLPRAKSGSEAASQLLASLLKWAQVICAKSGVAIWDWASSFADGQAVCLLVTHPAAELRSMNKVVLDISSALNLRMCKHLA
jgi:hypothetical protein